jgi:ribosomal protein L23
LSSHTDQNKAGPGFATETVVSNVRVLAVRTQNRVGKPRRTKTVYVNLKPWKRAIVKLHEDDRIAFF